MNKGEAPLLLHLFGSTLNEISADKEASCPYLSNCYKIAMEDVAGEQTEQHSKRHCSRGHWSHPRQLQQNQQQQCARRSTRLLLPALTRVHHLHSARSSRVLIA